MELQVGHTYRQRNGEVVTIQGKDSSISYPFYVRKNGRIERWTIYGVFVLAFQSAQDLVEEVMSNTVTVSYEITIPNGYELAEPTPRIPKVGEYYFTRNGNADCVRIESQFTRPFFILKKKIQTVPLSTLLNGTKFCLPYNTDIIYIKVYLHEIAIPKRCYCLCHNEVFSFSDNEQVIVDVPNG